MKNLTDYQNFNSERIEESISEASGCMSEGAKGAVKKLCEEILCKEAEDYHNDSDDSHTYEGYMNVCAQYLKEMMGQPGYQALTKTYAE